MYDRIESLRPEKVIEQNLIRRVADNKPSAQHGIPVSGREIIVHNNIMSLLTQGSHHMTADITSPACYQYLHAISPLHLVSRHSPTRSARARRWNPVCLEPSGL